MDHEILCDASDDSAVIETKTSTKRINVEWTINKQSINIAKLSTRGEGKGVIGTSVQHGIHTFNLELCVPGWRRSQDGYSAFYLTVPLKNNNSEIRNNINDNNDIENIENIENDITNGFVARYTISFGENGNMYSRISSIRNDFHLGVGFPNFSQISTLLNALSKDTLTLKLYVEIFEYASTTRQPLIYHNKQHLETFAAKLLSKMYYEKLNCDAIIIVNKKRIKVHKCVLTAASPILNTYCKSKNKSKSKENGISKIFMNQWSIEIVNAMIKFLYLNKIELNNNFTDNENDEYEEELYSSDDEISLTDMKIEQEGKVEEETKSMEEDIKKEMDSNNDEYVINKLQFHCGQNGKKLFELFQLATCYEMDELMIACCNEFRSYISTELCCFFLIYLDKYIYLNEIKDIKYFILEFIVKNIKSIKNTPGYLYVLQKKSRLLDEIIDRISQTCNICYI
eukprot:425841_1